MTLPALDIDRKGLSLCISRREGKALLASKTPWHSCNANTVLTFALMPKINSEVPNLSEFVGSFGVLIQGGGRRKR